MIRVALKGLAGRKFRAALTAIAIVLGVAMISGTYILTDTIDKAFDAIFEDSYAGTDAVVTGQGADISFEGERRAAAARASLLPQIGSCPTSRRRRQRRRGTARQDHRRRRQGDRHPGRPRLRVRDRRRAAALQPAQAPRGRWPQNGGEVVIDTGTADEEGFRIGDTVGIAALRPVAAVRARRDRAVRHGRLARRAHVRRLHDSGGAAALRARGQFDAISVAAKPGSPRTSSCRRSGRSCRRTPRCSPATAQAQEDSDEVSEFTSFIRYFLLAFAGISLFVGAFVIFNTLSITVAQRTREFASMRTIGASRRQILGSVVLEAFVIGADRVVRRALPRARARRGLNSLFKALGLDLPTTGARLRHAHGDRGDARRRDRDALAGLAPGAPCDAGAADRGGARGRDAAALAAVAVHAGSSPRSRSCSPCCCSATGCSATTSTAERLLSMAVGACRCSSAWRCCRRGSCGRWPRCSAGRPRESAAPPAGSPAGTPVRNPGRTAATAAALMIGIALVTFVAVLAAGHAHVEPRHDRGAGARRLRRHVPGRLLAVRRAPARRRRSAPGVTVAAVRSELGKAAGRASTSRHRPGHDHRRLQFEWQNGSDAVLGSSAPTAPSSTRVRRPEEPRGRRPLPGPLRRQPPRRLRGPGDLRAAAFYPLLGSVSISQERSTSLDGPEPLHLRQRERRPSDAEAARSSRRCRRYPDAKLLTPREWIQTRRRT